MPAMTPIKDILIIEDAIFYVDYAGKLTPAASVANRSEVVVVAEALARWHRKTEIHILSPADRLVKSMKIKAA